MSLWLFLSLSSASDAQLFYAIARQLTRWENHRTQSEVENSLVAKNFAFQFINNYFVLFYIAYLREVEDPISGRAHPCEGGNCLRTLQMQLAVVFTGKTIGKQIAYTLKPFVFKWYNQLVSHKATQKVVKQAAVGKGLVPDHVSRALTAASNVATNAAGELMPDMGTDRIDQLQQQKGDPLEKQLHMMPSKGMFDDFCDRVVQYGYLVLFASAFPLAPFLAFINNVIEIRTSGYKFCHGIQRPVHTPQQGIGSWLVVMNVLGFLAVLTNASMITFVGHQDAKRLGLVTTGFLDRTMEYRLWVTMFLVEHVVLLLRVIILVISPSSPAWVEKARETLHFRVQNKYKTEEELEREPKIIEEYNKMESGYRMLASHLFGLHREDIVQIFQTVDSDYSGSIDDDELAVFFSNCGVQFSKAEVAQALKEIDGLEESQAGEAAAGDDATATAAGRTDGEISLEELLLVRRFKSFPFRKGHALPFRVIQ
eukprot:SAG22_NODE_815_length_7037_cov_6.192130_5_plen_482_part_00